MSDLEVIAVLAQNPAALFLGALFLTAATVFLKEIKTSKGYQNDTSRDAREFNKMQQSIAEINSALSETVKILAELVSQGEDQDDCEAAIQRQLENLHSMVSDLIKLHDDPNSKFATVNLYGKFDNTMAKLNEIQRDIAKLK